MARKLLPPIAGVTAATVVASLAERWLGPTLAAHGGNLPRTVQQVLQISVGTLLPWLALIPLIVEVTRRVPPAKNRLGRFFVTHAGLLVAFGTARSLSHILVFHAYDMVSPRAALDNLLSGALNTLPYNASFYSAVVAARQALTYVEQLRHRDVVESRLAASLADARLEALRATLQPHFLFNALQSVNVLVLEQRTDAASDMLERLANLLRISMDDDHGQLVPLEHELTLLEHYLAIEYVRFADRLRVARNIAPDARQSLVPNLILQPLVENAIKHGLAKRLDAGRIAIGARRVGANLELEVENDGPALTDDWQQAAERGVGLTTTLKRLELLFPGAHRFEIFNAAAGGVVVRVTIPWRVPAAEA